MVNNQKIPTSITETYIAGQSNSNGQAYFYIIISIIIIITIFSTQKHQKVHDEIVRTVANVGTVSNVKTSQKELMFDLISSTPIQSESPVDKE